MTNSGEKKENIKVIYCMGSGRSGSTLFGIMLSNHTKIVGPGEISTVKSFIADQFTCSCGNVSSKCNYWTRIIQNWRNIDAPESVEQTLAKIRKIENFKSPIAWGKMILKYPFQSKYFKNYLEGKHNFLQSIATESGASVIFDISKNPLRAFVLSKHPNIDLRVVHLVRDGRGVAWSLHKKKHRPIWRSAVFWVVTNKLSNYVRKRIPHAGLIRYEDLIESPKETLHNIEKIVDFDLKPVIDGLDSNLAQSESHIMAGNKLRREKSIKLKLDTDWKENMGGKKKREFNRISKRTLKSYGYYH